MQRFKKRKSFCCRRQTSTRIIPENAEDLCLNFFEEIHDIIDEYDIQPENIHNFDQVPRYFESEVTTTITKKGAKNVKLRKGSTSHKKFTASFRVSASGEMFMPHALFADLKNIPKVHPKCEAAVNKTSMWSQSLLRNYINTHYGNSDPNTLYLFILDSYPVHIKFVKEEAANYTNIHFALVPKNLTSLLQPLDVSINKSFQTAFNDSYNSYIAAAIKDESLHTKSGNIKVPSYQHVTRWMTEWTAGFKAEITKNSFVLCGIVKRGDFDVQKLHEPLKELLKNGVSFEAWREKHEKSLNIECEDNFYELEEHEYYWPLNEKYSFFNCVRHHKSLITDLDLFSQQYITNIDSFVQERADLVELITQTDLEILKIGNFSGTCIELYAVAVLEKWKINYIELDKNQILIAETEYGLENPIKEITIINLDGYAFTKLNR